MGLRSKRRNMEDGSGGKQDEIANHSEEENSKEKKILSQ